MDSLLFSGNTGISGSIVTALPVTIAAGDTAQFAFSLDIGGAATTGNSVIDARFKATELRFGTSLSDTGAVNPATVTVFVRQRFPLAWNPSTGYG